MPGFEWFGEEERKEVQDVLDTGVLFRYGFDQARQGHWKTKSFEEELSRRVDSGYCHACSSGTAALWTALTACGIGAGDEIIVPPFTFIATIEAVLVSGAVPVFAEIDETLCLDPASVRDALTPRTRAVLPVHMCGAMARIDELVDLCRSKELILIEDACQAFGATFHGRALGTFGQAGCFSFDPVKTITCGEGGALVTNDQGIYLKADKCADHGHDHTGQDRGLEGHDILGINFRISELNAAVGLAQLRKLDGILERQRAHKKALKEALGKFSNIEFRKIPDEEGDSATFLTFLLPDGSSAAEAVSRLARAGVDGCFYWYDNNWHYFRKWDHLKKLRSAARLPITLLDAHPAYDQLQLPQSDHIMRRTISMLIKISWTKDDLSKRIEKMVTALEGVGGSV